MPIYEYNCAKCKINFEELVFGEKKPPCPKCGSSTTKKILSRPTLHCSSCGTHGASDGSGGGFAPAGGGCGGCSGGNCSSCGI